jgi:ubiquinone/menaquinone biosynthesis C-methylase UbiE
LDPVEKRVEKGRTEVYHRMQLRGWRPEFMEIKRMIRQLPHEKRCILQNIPKTAENIVEIGCGTGSFAFCISAGVSRC